MRTPLTTHETARDAVTPAGPERGSGHGTAAEGAPARDVRGGHSPAGLRICAAAADAASPLPRFEMTAYSGGTMSQWWSEHGVVVDLDGMELPGDADMPVLLQHDQRIRVGHADTVRVEGGALTASGVVSATSRFAREVVDDSRNGFPFEASIGAQTLSVESLAAGQTAAVNGREVDGPVDIVRRSRLKEISFVVLGADPETSARVAASYAASITDRTPLPAPHAPQDGDTAMDFMTWVRARGLNPSDLSNHQKDALRAEFDAEVASARSIAAAASGHDAPPAAPDPVAPPSPDPSPAPSPAPTPAATPPAPTGATVAAASVEEIRTAHAAEHRRVSAIRALDDRYRGRVDGLDDTIAEAISAGSDPRDVELGLVRSARPSVPAVGAGSAARPERALEAALCLSSGVPAAELEADYGADALNAAHEPDLRDAGIHTVMSSVLAAAGETMPHGRVREETIARVVRASRDLSAAGFSTMSVPGILSRVAGKRLLAAYNAVETVAHRVAEIVDVPDFKSFDSYRLTDTGNFELVGPSGELKDSSVSEEAFTNRVQTRGTTIALTRQHIVDDDLGAFMKMPAMLGRKAALALEEALFTLWLSNPGSFFGAGNNNLITGSATALGIDALTSAEQLFADQVDSNGKPVLVTPRMLLVPTSLGATAENLMKSALIVDGAAGKKPNQNVHAGKFEVVKSTYLNAQSIAGSSATAWYLLADPADVAAVQIAYLRGQRAPVIESGDADFSTLGVRFRAYSDFGVGMQDHRGAVKAAGA